MPVHRLLFGAVRLAAAAAVVMPLSAMSLSTAIASESETITWAVAPATEAGPDGRVWVELSLDPGDSAVEHLAVRNLSNVAATFELLAADGYFTHTGRFNMLPRTTESTGAGLWIDVQPSVDVAAGDTAVVPFTITAPDNAMPGDHIAGIAASVYSVHDDNGGAHLGVDSRVGFRVMTRVSGELTPSVTMTDPHAGYRMSWNPVAPGDVSVELELINDGNTRMSISGTVTAAGSGTAFGGTDPGERIELLPGDHRVISVTLDGIWPTFHVPVDVLTYVETATAEGRWRALESSPISVSTSAWAIPISQLAVLAGTALIVAALMFRRRRHRTHIHALIAQARKEGRDEALAASNSTEHNR